MIESIKFGPEWLRNTVAPATSGGGSSNDGDQQSGVGGGGGAGGQSQSHNGANVTKYPLAEFRYYREEMLSLFDINVKLPEILPKFKKLYVEKVQFPLAFSPPTEEEAGGTWPMIRSLTGPGIPGRGGRGGGRGGSVDRGRGRERGIYHYTRSTSLYDDDPRGAGRGERTWLERNKSGGLGLLGEGVDGSNSTSPRKEYGAYGRASATESWRRSRNDEEDWRSSGNSNRSEKWSARSMSWRNDDESSALDGASARGGGNGNGAPNERNKVVNSSVYVKKTWGDHDDNLPAWATENPSDYGGSFDASGAFHDADEDEQQYHQRMMQRRREHQQQQREEERRSQDKEGDGDASEPTEEVKDKKDSGGEKSKSEPTDQTNPVEPMDVNDVEASMKKMSMNSANKSKEEVPDDMPNDVQNSQAKRSKPVEPEFVEHLEKAPQPDPVKAQDVNSADDRLQQVADDMISKIFVDDDGVVGNELDHQSNHQPHMDMVPPPSSSSEQLWYYRDPQLKIQGPFSAGEMSEWYRAGYFDNTLMIRRSSDRTYTTLGDLVKLSAGVGRSNSPFLAASITHHLQMGNDLVAPSPEMSNSFHHPHNIIMVPPTPQNQSGGGGGNQQLIAPQAQQPNSQIPPQPDPYQIKLQYQMMQKQYLLRQQTLLIQKLTTTEQWHLLTPEQQTAMVNYHMSQLVLPDHLFQPLSSQQAPPQAQPPSSLLNNIQGLASSSSGASPAASSAFLKSVSQQSAGPTNPQQQMLPLQNKFGDSFGNMMASQQNHQQIHQQQQPQQPSSQSMTDNKIKSLIMQLSMQNPVQQPQHPSFMHQPQPSNAAADWMKQQQHSQNPQPRHTSAWSPANLPGNGNSSTPLGMWDLPTLPTTNMMHHQQQQQQQQHMVGQPQSNLVMKTEKQIIEEQMLNQLKETAASHKEILDDSLLPQQQQLYQQQSALLQQHHQQQQQQHQQQQQQQDLRSQVQKPQPQQQHMQSEEKKVHQSPKDEAQPVQKTTPKMAQKQPKDEKAKKDMMRQQEQAAAAAAAAAFEDDSNWKRKEGGEEKKKTRELKKQLEEEKRKQLAEEQKRKQEKEEKKKQDQELLLEQQKKAKVLEQQRREANRIQETQKSVKQPPSSAWQVNNNAIAQQQGLSLAEIQKLERERRATEKKLEMQHQMKLQQQAQQQLLEQQQKENILKWNAQSIISANIKSFEEIQAEEIAKQTAAERKREREMAKLNKDNEKLQTSIWNSPATYNNLVWNSDANQQTSSAGFWEEPTKPTPMSNNNAKNNPQKLSKSQTMGNIVTNKTAAAIVAQSTQPKQQQQSQQKSQHQTQKAKSVTNVPGGQQHQHNSQSFAAAASANQHNNNRKTHNNEAKHNNRNNGGGNNGDKNFNEFTEWCMKTLSAIEIKVVDVPTFIVFLQDIESPFEVKDYIKLYLGETKECAEFAKQFLERRSKYKNQQRAQAHVDDMCSPAPAINPQSNEFQEVKGKGKKVKKGKMMKLDNRILGFSVTAAADRINQGDREENTFT